MIRGDPTEARKLEKGAIILAGLALAKEWPDV